MTVEFYTRMFDREPGEDYTYRITNDPDIDLDRVGVQQGDDEASGLLVGADEEISDEQLLEFLRKCEYITESDTPDDLYYGQLALLLSGDRSNVAGWAITAIDISYGYIRFIFKNSIIPEIPRRPNGLEEQYRARAESSIHMLWRSETTREFWRKLVFTVRVPKRSGKYPKHKYIQIRMDIHGRPVVSEFRRSGARELLFLEATTEQIHEEIHPVAITETHL